MQAQQLLILVRGPARCRLKSRGAAGSARIWPGLIIKAKESLMSAEFKDVHRRLASDGAHSLTAEQMYAALASTHKGLSSADAATRLTEYGPNVLPHDPPPGVWVVFVRQFRNPLVYILLIAAAISAAMRDFSDAGFIFAVLLVNALIGSIQEYGAERSAEALRALTVARAYVVRDGEDQELPASELVPGDLVVLEAGSKIPADIRLTSDAGVEIDESLLTGESLAVSKSAGVVLPRDAAVADRKNMAFAGTLMTRGRALGVVVSTGLRTQVGKIASSLGSADATKPPLLVRMDRFTHRIAIAVGVAVLLLGGVSVARGSSVGEVFLLAVALAVSAIPEGLPVALTVALSIGARRMGQRKVIARRLVAVESLGSCTFIASDKTGTLTLNELTARRIALPQRSPLEIRGHGMRPEGEIAAPAEDRPLIQRLCTASALCNDGFFGLREGSWVNHGDAVDVALLVMAHKAGVQHAALEGSHPRIAEIPFEPEHRFAATLHREDGQLLAVVKGAGERVLPMCSTMATRRGDVPIVPEELERAATELAQAGYRVLAIAAGAIQMAAAANESAPLFTADHLRNLVFLGFVGMIDPLRPDAKDAIASCQAAGIQVAMVTGDHPVTALAIAQELGFAQTADQVVAGPMLARVAQQGSEAVDALVKQARVFARVEPNQKLQIVQSLTRLGHFVAVTGDGANDAPALRVSHIGVAMGERGTDVARESADLILTDDHFASIVAGVEEGRIAYANVRKVIYLLISSGLAEVLLFVLTTAFGLPAPLWPVQLLWLNLVTNGIQDVALAFEPGEGGELKRPPRPPKEPIFNRIMVERTAVSALLMALIAFTTYRWMLDHGWSVPQAQNGVLLLLVLFENIQAGNSRSETASLFTLGPLRNRLLLFGTLTAQALHIAAMHLPGLRDVLHLQPISLSQWLVTLGLALSLFAVSELHKLLLRRREVAAPTPRSTPR